MLVAVCVVIVVYGAWLYQSSHIAIARHEDRAISNGKQVLIALKQYAANYGSSYPDSLHPRSKSVNEVFRELFKEGVITDERIFIVPGSVFTADNDIGSAPAFGEALKPGECHWMMLKDQTDTSHPKMPVLIENALDTSWPPRWDVSPYEGKRKKGQAWPDRIVVVIRNDGSAAMEKLRPDGTLDWHSAPNLYMGRKSWIDYLTPEQLAKLEYWDVEERKTP